MHWSIKLYWIFVIITVIYFLFFNKTRSISCVSSCSKNDIQCQRDCEIEGNESLEVSM